MTTDNFGDQLDPREIIERVESIVEKIKPLLAGQPSVIVGAVLADLTSIWLAGHFPPELREELFETHRKAVWQLVAPAAGAADRSAHMESMATVQPARSSMVSHAMSLPGVMTSLATTVSDAP